MINKVNIIITHHCNLFCRHCYMNATNNCFENNQEILNRFIKIIPILKENNIKEVMLTGGECTISKNFKKIIEICKKENIRIGIFTNGMQIMQEELKNIDNFCLSLDGNKEFHNNLRGSRKSYDNLLKNIRILKDNKKDITIQMTVSNDNIKDIISTSILLNNLEIKKINICCLLEEGRCLDNNIDTSIDFSKLKKIIYKSIDKTGYNLQIHTNIFNEYSIKNFLLNNSIIFPLWIDLVDDSFYLVKNNSIFSDKLTNFSSKNIKMIYNRVNDFIQNNKDYFISKNIFVLENEIIKLLYKSGGINE